MGKDNIAPATAGATPEEVAVVQEVQEVQEAQAPQETEATATAEVIPANVFVAEDGTELEFAVQHFICPNGQHYKVEEAIANAPEVLEVLYKAKSFIFKK